MLQSSYYIRKAFDSLLSANQRVLIELFEKKGIYITKREGEIFTFDNSTTKGFLWMLSGGAKEITNTEQCYHIFIAGDFIGLKELFAKQPVSHTLHFVSAVNRLLFVPIKAFLALQQKHPGIAAPLIRKIHMDVTQLEDRAISICQNTTAKRLEQLFQNLQLRWGKPSEDWVPLMVSMEDLAQMVGASRNTTLRIIKAQREQGLLELEKNHFRWLGAVNTLSKREERSLHEKG